MKKKDRIVELLAESLKRQDRQEDILNGHTKILSELVNGQIELVKGQRELIDQFHRMNDHLLTRQEK